LESSAAEPKVEVAISDSELDNIAEQSQALEPTDISEISGSRAENIEQQPNESLETYDPLDLPEYSEEDALADMPIEEGISEEIDESLTGSEPAIFNESELPEYSEADALADMPIESLDDQETDFQVDGAPQLEESAPSDAVSLAELMSDKPQEDAETDRVETKPESEQDALFDVFQAQDLDSLSRDEFDESALSELLSEPEEPIESQSFSFDTAIDTTTSDSAGMDIEAMLEVGGEDWNGFNLSPEQQASISSDIPENEQAIWSGENKPEQAVVSDEDWESQDGFGPNADQYRTIDELMAEVDSTDEVSPDDEELNLNVGLDEFPDVIGDIGFEDVDNNAEAVGKLDLAKIYMEMNDPQGAIKLLEEAIVDGSDNIRREAKSLIDSIRNV
jgi:pilus assembly protein FimV